MPAHIQQHVSPLSRYDASGLFRIPTLRWNGKEQIIGLGHGYTRAQVMGGQAEPSRSPLRSTALVFAEFRCLTSWVATPAHDTGPAVDEQRLAFCPVAPRISVHDQLHAASGFSAAARPWGMKTQLCEIVNALLDDKGQMRKPNAGFVAYPMALN